ncbi:MAG: SRPBCC family protein [Acidimicrobiia bacterium]
MRLHEQRKVHRPLDEVYEYTADFSNIENWDPGVVSSRRLDSGPIRVGTKYELQVKFGGSVVPMTYEINRLEPGERVVLIGKGDKLDAIDEISFSEAGDLTVIDYVADITFHNFFKYLVPLIAPAMRKVGERALDGLVGALEQ